MNNITVIDFSEFAKNIDFSLKFSKKIRYRALIDTVIFFMHKNYTIYKFCKISSKLDIFGIRIYLIINLILTTKTSYLFIDKRYNLMS
jgi:hypothetical protein